MLWSGADPDFVGPEAYTIFGAPFKKKNTKLGTKVNIHLWPLPRPWKRPMQVSSSELQLYQLHSKSTPGFGIENYRSSVLGDEQVLRLIMYTC
jgi:hypothetical protein